MGIRGNRRLYIGLGLFGLAGTLNSLAPLFPPLLDDIVFMLNHSIYTGIIIFWGISVHRRLLPTASRRYPVCSSLLMLFWMLMRVFRYRLVFSGSVMDRLSWYAYYIPQVLLPLLFVYSSLSIRMRESYRPARTWRLLYIPAVLLILGVLTNDWHELAFRFTDAAAGTARYTYGPLYFAVVIWNAGLFLYAVAVISFKVRLSPARGRLWQVLIWLAGYATYLVFLTARGHLPSLTPLALPYNYPEISCFTMIAVWESCIRTHLIPSNAEYPYFFAHASIAAQITDSAGRVAFRAENAPALTAEQMLSAESGPVLLDRDTRLSSRAILGGHVYWTESLADLNRQRDELAAAGGTLSEQMNLLAAENRLRRRETQIRERTAIYESVADALEPQLCALQALFSEPASGMSDRQMAEACVLGAYIKRRANLLLLAADAEDIPAGELALCVRESLTYLRLIGADCALSEALVGALSAHEALLVYDFFEWAAESSLAGLHSMLVRLDNDRSLTARIILEAEPCSVTAPWDDGRLSGAGARSTLSREDGALLLELRLPRGGGSA